MFGTRTRITARRLLLPACLLAVLLIPAAGAAPGALDPTFGSGGKVVTPIGAADSEAFALARKPDGKLVAVGYGSNGSGDDFALRPGRTLAQGARVKLQLSKGKK